MRIVFLDFDGVVTTNSSYRGAPCIEVPQAWGPPETVWTNPPGLLVPGLVANVQALCEASEASIVISSDWRKMHRFDDLVAWLRSSGLSAPVVGATPVLHTPRGLEIQAWVEQNSLTPQDLVILEDEEDVRPYRGRQVRTAFGGPRQGFTERHLRTALRMWGLAPPGRRAQVD